MIKRATLLAMILLILGLSSPVLAAEAGSGVIEGRVINGRRNGRKYNWDRCLYKRKPRIYYPKTEPIRFLSDVHQIDSIGAGIAMSNTRLLFDTGLQSRS